MLRDKIIATTDLLVNSLCLAVATKVLSKSHSLNGARLEVNLHSTFLGKPLSQPEAEEVELVASIPVDSQVMLFICEHHKADFKQVQDDHGVTTTWEEGTSSIMVRPSDKMSADRKTFDEACEAIASFKQQFHTTTSHVLPEAWKAVVDIFMKNASAMEKKVKVHCVAQQHVISLTGKKQDVEGLGNDLQELKTIIERKVKLKSSIETRSIDIDQTVRLQFLRDVDFGKELEAEHEETQVSILLETGKVQIRAPPNTFHKVSAMIWETIAKVTEISLEMSQNAVELLRSTACRAFINDQFTANNLQAGLAFDSARKDSLIVMGMNTAAAEKASKLVKRLVVEECVDLDEDQVQLEKSEKWSQLRYDLTEKRILSLSFDRRNKKMWLVGTKDDVSFALAAVTRFLKENTIVSNVVKLPTGCRRFLAKYREQELRQIEEDLKEHSTRIKRVADEDDEDLIISGTTDGVEKGTKLVQDLASQVSNEKLFLYKPGMRKVLGQSKGKKLLSRLGNENKCVIEHYISEEYKSSKKAGEEQEEKQRKKEVCQPGLPPSAGAGSEKMKRGRSCGVTIKSSDPGDSYLEIFAGTKQHIDKVIKDIEKDVADHCKVKVIVHDAICMLSKQQTRKIRDLQAEHDVLVTIEEAISRISIRGHLEDVLDVATTIHEILNQKIEEDYLRKVEELLAENIQWFFRDDDGSWEPYDTRMNLQIENAFHDGQDSVIVEIDDVKCEIVFKDMKETCFEDGEERLVVRKEFEKGKIYFKH